ncbi:MAG: AAA family ATPase [Aigarchaeota archaeon]|nr:AAA family ATPase [Aigarchaeota archaeon]MCX8192414.1 AAA family ATPase [Nitrososphaeria archaeon]MDW7986620.1 AAA family ATPase [Nitrososphaerota archaeon]
MGVSESSVEAIRERTSSRRTYIREVILENFMSHEYSRIPLNPRINIVTGPNGAGKSSILLGIAVALGQTYTERSQRLSDLIRRGEESARVSIVFDNKEVDGERPIPWINSDQLVITRYIKKNGDYWHYVNNRFKTKAEVEYLLQQLGINPNNMLIIMHQNMIEQFAAKSNIEKLKMVEDAIGASHFRRRIIEAEEKLKNTISEAQTLKRALDEAKAAVEYWRDEYEKLVKKNMLEEQKKNLELEYSWAEVQEVEEDIYRLQEKREALKIEALKLRGEVDYHHEEAGKLREELLELFKSKESLESFERKLESTIEEYVAEALARYKLEINQNAIKKIDSEISRLESLRNEKIAKALVIGERPKNIRRTSEIIEDIKTVTLKIASLGEISPEAEDMYLIADARYRETEVKSQQVEENLKKALEEVEHRKENWRNFLRQVISEVEPRYNAILSYVDGAGKIMLRNLENPEEAHLELFVGFRGAGPVLLDAYTLSGGERIVATLAFLLALQNYVKSPFRAVDEFDVHLDPLNRERMVKLIIASAKNSSDSQYFIITPGKLPVEEDVNILVVQNISGRSMVGKVGE